jgi:hypothetical protein
VTRDRHSSARQDTARRETSLTKSILTPKLLLSDSIKRFGRELIGAPQPETRY